MAMTLPVAVTTLTRDHPRIDYHPTTGEELHGTEPALLVALEAAFTPSTGGGAGSYGQTSGSAVNFSAMELRDTIRSTVTAYQTGAGRPAEPDRALTSLLEITAYAVMDTPEYGTLLEDCHRWVREVRHTLTPPARYPLRGMPCPACGATWSRRWEAGEQVRTEALEFFTTETAANSCPQVECASCAAVWQRGQILDLKAALHYT